MTDTTNLPGKPIRSNFRRTYVMVGIMVVGAIIIFMKNRSVDDKALAQALVGTWTAVDPSDASLHRRGLPVIHEQLIIGADDSLTHVVELASKPDKPEHDLWKWKVRKGRLYVRFQGEDAGGQWLPGFPFSVSDKALSIGIKDHPPKKWIRP